ncbi:immobilization antigen (macronuclear) [Tetrahymena thermophila SB210]|uniref:Immobilization antigen n=1 Tax=Tetrahymena thermophila (strain SB210) TaxID=312017 RepID=W7X2H4_TETTS|nr:immobilization antigen [Tetrahymena thermophila SB210]EWS73435.1 immobilization antigen [Tetrahymena thermophila SB210]|eukprot:XP_012654006.1 immobilization antigen [Tetrahymena thermophila SB210]
MKKFLVIFTLIKIIASQYQYDNFANGLDVSCGTPNQNGGIAIDCNGCGVNSYFRNYFIPSKNGGSNCIVADCVTDPVGDINGWMCGSCATFQSSWSYGGPNFIYLENGICKYQCDPDYISDENYICKYKYGNEVSCGNVDDPAYFCKGCSDDSNIYTRFIFTSYPNCKYNNCISQPLSGINSWVCKSCIGVIGVNKAFKEACLSKDVGCGTAGASGGNATNCNGCGDNSTIQSLFSVSATPNCKVTDCSSDPGSNLNSWMCRACNGVIGAHSAYSGGQLLSGAACVASCPSGYYADSNYICIVALYGADVGCGSAGASGGNATNCNGCGDTSTIQNLFSVSATPNCKVTDCSSNPGSNLNGWMCKSCNGVTNAHSAYSAGKLLSGTACVASCPSGYYADSNYICIVALYGADVGCGSAGASGGNATNCNGCGDTSTIQNLFSVSATPNCKVTDCSSNPGSNLNGWMCKSCNGVTNAHSAYSAGKLLSGTACVASCPSGYYADSNYICKVALYGADVGCGSAGASGGNATNCNGCGDTSTIQNLFSVSATPNCKVIDCSSNPGSNLNGWMCKSCNGVTNAHSAYSAGKLLSGTACVASCPSGYYADSNYICKVAANGADVGCGSAGASGGNATNCNGCGDTSTIQNLFSVSATPNCKVIDCSSNPGSNLNGWMCKSCNGVTNAHSAYSAGKLLSGTACIASCPSGYYADSNYICKVALYGADVGCGSAGASGGNATNCNGCGDTSTIQNLFSVSATPNCKVTDCSSNPGSNLNGWMCKSCNGVTNAHSAYSAGKLLSGTACVASCPSGYYADSNYICIVALYGADVGCGSAGASGGNATNCNGCGDTSTIQNLFSVSATPNCKVTDCSSNPGSNLNGWMCKSCNGVTNAHSAYSAGKLLSGTACVASCPSGYYADSNYICKVAANGADVGCGSAGASGGNATNCNGCGDTSTIQNLFSVSATPNCKVTDCSSNPGSNLNGWMCKSCNGVTNAHSAYSAGKLLSGTACVASCPSGYYADSNYICKVAANGADVGCGSAGASGGNATNCNGCGDTSTIQNLFSVSATPNCKVIDCSSNPGSNLNGWMCKSCNGVTNAHSAYSAGKLLSGTACIASCPSGYYADSNYICKVALYGADVGCGSAGASGGNATNCNGCGDTSTIQNLFSVSATPNCKVTDCSSNPGSNLNGWMCKSCNGVTNAHSAYSAGKLLSGTACVASCPSGYYADSNYICKVAANGADVGCGSAGASGSNATNCNGCGDTSTIQNLFSVSATPNCKVTDCSSNPGSNLNGWMCKSCNGVTNAHSAYSAGKFLSGTACVASCPSGYYVDSNNICQVVVNGADVGCGNAGVDGGKATDCNECGSTSTIQNLFSVSATPNCKVTDCSSNPGSNLNGWMCKSCNGVSGSHTAYSAGKFFNGSACVASCNLEQTSDSNNVCQAECSLTTSQYLLMLTFIIFFLFLII